MNKIILNNNFDVISLQKDSGLEQINNNYKNKIYDFVCRWNGGHNAGHTIYKNGIC